MSTTPTAPKENQTSSPTAGANAPAAEPGRNRNRNRNRNRRNRNRNTAGDTPSEPSTNNQSAQNNNTKGNKGGNHNNANITNANAEPKTVSVARSSFSPFGLCDIGINLCHRSYGSHWREVSERGVSNGVTALIVTGTSVAATRKAAKLCAENRGPAEIRFTAGVHPHDSKHYVPGGKTADELRAIVKGSNGLCVAIGECGLDYDRDFSPRDAQRAAMREQVLLGMELDLPLFLHSRAACDDFVRTWSEAAAEGESKGLPSPRGVVHCFTGDGAELDRYLSMGFYIGVTGFICNPSRCAETRACLGKVPRDRLLLETDGPFMRPRNAPRGAARVNEPSLLPYVLQEVAGIVGRDPATVAEDAQRATELLFGFSVPNQPGAASG